MAGDTVDLMEALGIDRADVSGREAGRQELPRCHLVAHIPSRFPDLQICNSLKIGVVGCQICQSVSSHNCKMSGIHSQ
jgi:hypothetical protein